MAHRLALIGLPFSGKTTVLQVLCMLGADHLHHVGEQGERVGTVKFSHDERLSWLAELHHSKKQVPMSLEVWDFPGFDLASESGRNQVRRHLGEVRQCELLVMVLRGFNNPSVPCYHGQVDPARDLEELMEEFVFADMEQVTRRIEKLEQQTKKPTPTREQNKRELDLLKRCLTHLEEGKGLDDLAHNAEEEKMLRGFALLTQRPCVVIINTDEDRLGDDYGLPAYAAVKKVLVTAAEYERQLDDLSPEDREAFLADAHITDRLGEALPAAGLAALNVIMFFTATETEARAWPLESGVTAVEAAAKIHTDMARGFIRAETIQYDQLRACGSYKEARAQGKLRLEGKEYIIQDGDVVLFRFNV